MATERMSMRKTREIFRHKWVLKKSHREVVQSLGVSLGAVTGALDRARSAGLVWADVEKLSDDELEARLYRAQAAPSGDRPKPDPVWIHLERKKQGVTLELLHLEYLERHPNGYQYTAFCEVYRRWLKKRQLSMRQIHRAGEKLFVDYSGKRPSIFDPKTGEESRVELFVAVLGASNYTYAEASLSQKSTEWIASHVRALEYLGGVPHALVPDQLKSGVIDACRYEPKAQRTYEELARHYGTALLPARPGKPRDKAKAEAGVLVVQRWILARLRNERFFSLEALNDRIAELLEELNNRPMRRYGGKARRQLFEELDRPALLPLPVERFVHAVWKDAGVNIDYHVEHDKHFYSVPYTLVHESVEVRATAMTVEILHKGQRIASHVRSYQAGGFTTAPEHRPKSHREHAEWTPSRLIAWAGKVGPNAKELVAAILEERPHPEQGYRSCLGIMRLAKQYGDDRLDAACRRALAVRARSYKHVANILKHGLDQITEEKPKEPARPPHENVRGPGYYH
jgi:transposase